MIIRGLPGFNQGFVGIGNGFTTPQSLLHIHDGGLSYLHVTNTASGSGGLQGVRFGLFGPTAHAVIAQQNPFNMYFITAGAAANAANIRMSIVGLAGPTQGFVGIGTSHTTPDNLLDVLGGDIDLETSTRSYMIRDSSILWHKGNSGNLYVGTGAGFSQPLNSGLMNTYVGYRAGYVSTINDFENTYIGHEAGANTQPSTENVLVGLKTGQFYGGFHATFVGNRAGINALGVNNSFYGFSAGRQLTGSNNCIFGLLAAGGNSVSSAPSSSQNVFMGVNAGFLGVGDNNVAVGYFAANTQTAGINNTYVGENSAIGVQTGTNNTFIGSKADVVGTNTAAIVNAAAIGANAQVANNNHMILGDNNVNVGIGLSGSTLGPQKKLEINETGVTSPTVSNGTITGTFGGSGLRFTKLTSATPTSTNPGSGVLGVSANGDVIYVDGAGGGIFGSACSATTGIATLPNNRRLEMNGFDINFTVPTGSVSQINLGFPTCTVAPARLNVSNTATYQTAAAFSQSLAANGNIFSGVFQTINSGNGGAFGLSAGAIATTATANAIGVSAASTGTASFDNIGFNAAFRNGNNSSIGLNADITNSTTPSSSAYNAGVNTEIRDVSTANSRNFGIDAAITVASGSTTPGAANYGGRFSAVNAYANYGIAAFTSPVGTVNIAVFGSAPGAAFTPTSSSGITGTYAGYFDGHVVRTGSDNFTSDQNLKQNFDTIPNAIGIIKQLKPKTFDYKLSSYPSMSLPGGKQYGLIAQETQTVLPELINNIVHPAKYDSVGNIITPSFTYLSLEYQQLTPIIIRAMQQQQRTIEKQDSTIAAQQNKINKQDSINNAVQAQIAALTSSVSSCCSSSAVRQTTPAEQNQLAINLSDKDIIVLNQNVPNPFAEQTTITYNVPEKYGYAQMIFSTIDGRILKTVDITKKGRGAITVYSNDLSSGLYSYSLVVDGKTFDTKKMVKSE